MSFSIKDTITSKDSLCKTQKLAKLMRKSIGISIGFSDVGGLSSHVQQENHQSTPWQNNLKICGVNF